MHTLACAVGEENRKENYKYYVAFCLNRIAEAATIDHGGEWKLPNLYEMEHPQEKPKRDDRTGREIVDDIVKRLSK